MADQSFNCGDEIPKTLQPLKDEALKYDDFKEFSGDYSWNLMRGKYWHITDNPNFELKKDYSPRDLSSMAGGYEGPPGLMVSYTPEVWREYFANRKYAVSVDLSKAQKNKDYTIVNRGFGHEIFISNLDKIEVSKPILIESAMRDQRRYQERIPNSPQDLCCLWKLAKLETKELSKEEKLEQFRKAVAWCKETQWK